MDFNTLKREGKNEVLKYVLVFIASVTVSLAISYFLFDKSIAKETAVIANSVGENTVKSGKVIHNIFGDEVIADVVEEAAKSVVHITTESEVKVRSFGSNDFFFEDEFFKKFFGIPQSPFKFDQKEIPYKRSGNGSGIITSSDGYILTNYHVVGSASKITVKTNDGKEYDAKLLGKDKYSDLAIIKVDAKGLNAAKLADSDKLRPGQWAIAVGSPHGLDHTVTLGIVSAVRRDVPQLSNVSFIQTDAAINPGNSGGPLVNIKGEVMGVNTAIMGTAQNIGFAIPINTAKDVFDVMKSGKTVDHPWIGIAMGELTPELSEALGVSKNTKGVLIAKVMPNSPAAKAGLQRGDIVQKIDGKKFEKPDEVQKYVKKKKVGEKINIQILRDGTMEGKSLKVGTWGGND